MTDTPKPRGRAPEGTDWAAIFEQEAFDFLFWLIVDPYPVVIIWSEEP